MSAATGNNAGAGFLPVAGAGVPAVAGDRAVAVVPAVAGMSAVASFLVVAGVTVVISSRIFCFFLRYRNYLSFLFFLTRNRSIR